jgi:hypothetical protein
MGTYQPIRVNMITQLQKNVNNSFLIHISFFETLLLKRCNFPRKNRHFHGKHLLFSLFFRL